MERLEIIDRAGRRRFGREMKLHIVVESYSEPGLCATTARRHGISRSQLYEWRRLDRAWQRDAALPVGGFVRALLAPEAEPAAGSLPNDDRMEVISTNGRRVIVGRDVDVEAVLGIMRGLEALW